MWFQRNNLVAIKSHIVEVHRGESNASLSILSDMVESSLEESNPAVSILSDVSDIEDNSLEGLGIEKLPVITQRRKQNLKDLNIDANGPNFVTTYMCRPGSVVDRLFSTSSLHKDISIINPYTNVGSSIQYLIISAPHI